MPIFFAKMRKGLWVWFKNQCYQAVHSNNEKRFYRILGMRRSGNHAIINWLMGQLPGPVVFLDNMQQHPPLDTPNKKVALGLGRPSLVVSHEGRELNNFFMNYDEGLFGKARTKYTLLILRDPYNWLASWYAWQDELGILFRKDRHYQQYTINLWKEYARLYIQCVKGKGAEEIIPVNYNKWTADVGYRQQLANHLGLKFTDKGRNKMSINGYGSSFDGMAYNGRASQLNVLERYKKFENDAGFQALFDEELKQLSAAIYPEIKLDF